MKKILDIIIIFLIAFLVLSLFQSKDEPKQTNNSEKLSITSLSNSYSIPVNLVLKLRNNTNSWIILNTCKDFKLNKSWTYINLDKNSCKDISLNPLESKDISYWETYKTFSDIWDYRIETNILWEKKEVHFKVEHQWSISKLFTYIFYAPAYNLMVFLLEILSWSLWLAIIAITIILRILLLWPQNKMLISQRKLQAIQPKIKEIQEKYKWQNQVLWMKIMELYKQEKVNPMWSCGFLLMQMPILIVIYNVILNIKEHTNYYYLYSFLENFNLSSVNFNFLWIDLLATWWIVGILLWLIVWWVQFLQIKLSMKTSTSKSDNKSIVLEKKKGSNDYSSMMPDPELMNKFMLYWMPLMIAVFTYLFPAWLGLYWGLSTMFMIVQQLIVNKNIK